MRHRLADLPAFQSLRYPIIQAPMAGVSTPALAGAVSRAGGLGSISVGAQSPLDAAAQIAATRAACGDAPFNVNLFCHAPARRDAPRENGWRDYLRPAFAEFDAEPPGALHEIYRSFCDDAAMLEVILQTAPAVVSFHFGLPPAHMLKRIFAAGIITMATATNVEEAARIEDAGVHVIVAQGIEAGGHRGVFDPAAADDALPAEDLLRLLVARATLPVVAAGGLMDGRDIRRMLGLGAAAVQLGTAFVACPESAASADHRARLQDPQSETRMTSAISGRPARGIYNRFMQLGEAADIAPPDYPVAYDIGKALHAAAATHGDHGFAAQWAGTGFSRSRALPAGGLLHLLAQEAGL